MLEYIFIGAIGTALILLYCLINSQGVMCKLFRKALTSDKKRNRCKVYLERFREHRQNGMGRNIVMQILPWVGVLALVFVLGNQYLYFGTVLSGSMEPTFKKGDIVLMQTIDKEPKVGDIIMFSIYGMTEPVTHRVISVDKSSIIRTKGDANPTEDSWNLRQENIVGKAITAGGQPIVIKGLGAILVPEAGPFSILTKLPQGMEIMIAFQRFRSLMPLIILFCTIFYFFTLMETRMEQNRRFNNYKNDRNRKNSFTDGQMKETKAE